VTEIQKKTGRPLWFGNSFPSRSIEGQCCHPDCNLCGTPRSALPAKNRSRSHPKSRGDVPTQRCGVHKHRNPLAHALQRLHEEVSADYADMIYAASPAEIEARRRAFIRKWRLKCKAVADSLEEAGDRLFMFTRLPLSQWKSARTTNVIERLHEEFKRRIKTQTVLPSAETAAMLFWALLAAGQITMRKVDGWRPHILILRAHGVQTRIRGSGSPRAQK
jgi:hypothetical protein